MQLRVKDVLSAFVAIISFARARAKDVHSNSMPQASVRSGEQPVPVLDAVPPRRFLVQNCVVQSNATMSIVSQLSMDEGSRRRLDESFTCVVEVSHSASLALSVGTDSSIIPSITEEDYSGEKKVARPKGAMKRKTKGPQGFQGSQVFQVFWQHDQETPIERSEYRDKKSLRRDLKGSMGGEKDSKTNAAKNTCSPTQAPTQAPMQAPMQVPTEAPDALNNC